MNRILSASLVAAGCLCLLPAVSQANPLTEDFEAQPTGSKGSDLGWTGLYGTSAATVDAWKILNPAAPAPTGYPTPLSENTTRGVFATPGGGASNYQMAAPFRQKNGLKDSDTVYYSVIVRPSMTGNNIQDLRFGGRLGENGAAILFGVHGNNTNNSSPLCKWQVGAEVSKAEFPAAHWYQLQLVIDPSGGPAAMKGSLQVRDITAGAREFTPVEGLQEIPLKLTGPAKPSQWTGWAVRSYGRQVFDDLYLSNTPVAK